MTEPEERTLTESTLAELTLARLIGIFDVVPSESEPGRFTGRSDDGGGRDVVDGSQLLAQSIVAASKALPGRTARSAHALFVAAAHPAKPLDLTVTPVRAGRMFASAIVTVSLGDRTCATCTVLLDQPQPDVIRRDRPVGERGDEPAAESASGPQAAISAASRL